MTECEYMYTTTRVDADALEALKVEVLRKHGKLQSVLAEEITAAVRAHTKRMVEIRQEETADV